MFYEPMSSWRFVAARLVSYARTSKVNFFNASRVSSMNIYCEEVLNICSANVVVFPSLSVDAKI